MFTQDDQVVVIDMSAAFAEDSLANSHPIRIPITRPEEIKQIFDSITYEKVLHLVMYYAITFTILFSSDQSTATLLGKDGEGK